MLHGYNLLQNVVTLNHNWLNMYSVVTGLNPDRATAILIIFFSVPSWMNI
jgi:hypothetical protein